jgi:hypothetical protein
VASRENGHYTCDRQARDGARNQTDGTATQAKQQERKENCSAAPAARGGPEKSIEKRHRSERRRGNPAERESGDNMAGVQLPTKSGEMVSVAILKQSPSA